MTKRKRVRCLDVTYSEDTLTANKTYEVVHELHSTYVIKNDKGLEQTVSKIRFEKGVV